ncbi:hypothetical protein BKA81DRAFT_213223 [Phyllosticta paracitricarpa]
MGLVLYFSRVRLDLHFRHKDRLTNGSQSQTWEQASLMKCGTTARCSLSSVCHGGAEIAPHRRKRRRREKTRREDEKRRREEKTRREDEKRRREEKTRREDEKRRREEKTRREEEENRRECAASFTMAATERAKNSLILAYLHVVGTRSCLHEGQTEGSGSIYIHLRRFLEHGGI